MISKKVIVIYFIFSLFINILYSNTEDVISWKDAHKHYGEYVTVKGKIVSTYNSGKACFLNFHPDYKKYFTAVIFKSDFHKFPSVPEDYYYMKNVEVTGIIKLYKGKPEIILKNPNQIKITDGTKKQVDKTKIVTWKDAHKYYGEYVTVEGVIVSTYNSGKACFLNFHRNYRKYFTAVIFASDFNKFEENPEDYYKGKRVWVTGIVKEYKGKPEIILKDPRQIKVIK